MTAIPARAALLAETSWLADHLDDPHLSIADIRGSIMPAGAPAPHDAVSNCASSWYEWESEPGNPIEKGQEPGT